MENQVQTSNIAMKSQSEDVMIIDSQVVSFHQFGELPLPIRNKIWGFSVLGARLVEVIWMEGEEEDGWYTNAPILPALSVCRESRLEALKTHPLSFPCDGYLARIPFNFSTDTLLLGSKMSDTSAFFKKERVGKDLSKVQYLMVNASVQWGRREKNNRGRGNLGGMSHLIFGSVKEHTVLYTGDTDPLPFWIDKRWFNYGYRSRAQGHNQEKVIARFKELFPDLPGRIRLHQDFVNEYRYGGLWNKYDLAIACWKVPKVYSFGVPKRVSDSFDQEAYNWPMILMDRVIEDIFT